MKLLEIKDKKILQDFLILAAENSGAEFLASIEWAEIIRNEELVETLGVYDDAKLIAVFNLVKKDFRFGLVYYYLPRGPIFAPDLLPEKQSLIWQFLIVDLKKRGGFFLRVEPKNYLPKAVKALPSINLQPQKTLMLDLSLTTDELLASFHPKTRYNIKLAQKKGVTICDGKTENDFNNFWSLMTETGERDGFKIHNKQHYKLLATANSDFIKLFSAQFNGQTIAAGLFAFYGDKVTYLHGASAYSSRQLMAPYLLQWTMILQAKEAGYKYYDFYGIDANKWPGVTRFKLGFNGHTVTYAGTRDVILNQWSYCLYNFLRRLRRLF